MQKNIRFKRNSLFRNLNAKRDWGHAKDYTEMQWKILQQSKPDDYVIATGKAISVRGLLMNVVNI